MMRGRKNLLFVSSTPHIAGGEVNLLALLDSIDTTRFNPYCLYNPLSRFDIYKLQYGVKLLPLKLPGYMKKNFISVASVVAKLAFFLIWHKIDLRSLFDA